MNFGRTLIIVLGIQFWTSNILVAQSEMNLPSLRKHGEATQLIVSGKPFLVLGGELGNSSASDMAYLSPAWATMKAMHCNTMLTPVYWEMIEPEKGKYDFSTVDALIDSARKHDMKLVLLWFGVWKNSMSCYAPSWVKKDFTTYPRAHDKHGRPQEILSPFSENNLNADIAVFKALISHVKERDRQQQTVIMIQVENEIGMLPDARDHRPEATKAFQSDVPKVLIRHLEKNKNNLSPSLLAAWKGQGFKTSGNWETVFGKGLATDELFIAWYFAVFANRLAEEGKKVYPLPMFVNAALNRPNAKPGDYPSGGPLPHIIDVWKAAGPAIDFLSPDFYNPNFKQWNDLYARPDNPLFIPEIRFEPSVGAKSLYAVGHYHAIGFSPFSIESTDRPGDEPIGKCYALLEQLEPLIMATQGHSNLDGFLLDKTVSADTLTFDDYTFIVKHDYTLGWSPNAKDETWPSSGGLIIQTGKEEFFAAGTGFVVTFQRTDGVAGILSIEEGSFADGKWKKARLLNGDQSHQGRHLRIPAGEYGIQKLKLYTFK
jgi:hypothetical protein